jgi:hypothetical protein
MKETLKSWNDHTILALSEPGKRINKYKTNENEATIDFAFVPSNYNKIPENTFFPQEFFEFFTQENTTNRQRMSLDQEGQGPLFIIKTFNDQELCHIKFHINGVVTGSSTFDVETKHGYSGFYTLIEGFKYILENTQKYFWNENNLKNPVNFITQISGISEKSKEKIDSINGEITFKEPLFIPIQELKDNYTDSLELYLKNFLGKKFVKA